MALSERQPAPGLVPHSDRGVQYASLEYTEMLRRGVPLQLVEGFIREDQALD